MLRRLFSRFGLKCSAVSQRRPGRCHARLLERLEERWYLTSDPIVSVNTNYGNFQLELFPTVAPQTVANFLQYVDGGKWNDAVVTRSIPGFVVQTGGLTSASTTYTSNAQFSPVQLVSGQQNPTIPLEYKLPNTAGTIAMARGSAANSGSDEWFINLVDNSTNLGPGGVDANGYAVFGQVIGNGMQVVNKIASVPTKNAGSMNNTDLANLPVDTNNNNQLVQIASIYVDSVDGTVFNDANGNGQQDTGEAGIAGRTVFVDVDGTGKPDASNPSAVTDANGNYSIHGVPVGTFTVREVLPGGVGLTTPLQTVTFAADQTATNVNLGEGPAITGTVFTDSNGNGKLDAGEQGIAGRTVFLNIDNTGQPDAGNPSTTTDANGHFAFSGIASGTYNVMEVTPAKVTLSTNTSAIQVTANHPAAVANIGEVPSITGTVFNDLNVNGKFDAGEPGIADVTVFINIDGSGKPGAANPSTTTDANGNFTFSGLSAGSYTVREVSSSGMTLTTPTAAVTVGASQPPTVDLGNVLTSPMAPLPISLNTSTPISNANGAFVDELFFNLLGRHADSASLSYWEQQLSSGTSRQSVAQAIWNSAEHRGLEVEQFYHTYLGRASDPQGKSFWVDAFNTWGTEKLETLGFLTSAEYQATLHPTDADFVTALYTDVALRPADSAGLTFWQNALSSGQTRLQVAQAFVNGQEASARLIDSFYAAFLHRAADPTTQAMVTNLMQDKDSVEAAAISVLASDEYFTLAGKGG